MSDELRVAKEREVNSEQGAGETLLAVWREAGEWWSFEPVREFVRSVDERGLRRERERLLPSVGKLRNEAPKPEDEDYRDEWNLRLKKTRDEKVARACGLISKERILGDPAEDAKPSLTREGGQFHSLPDRSGLRSEYGMRIGASLDDAEAQLRVAEDLAPYGLSRKEIGRARRLRKLKASPPPPAPSPYSSLRSEHGEGGIRDSMHGECGVSDRREGGFEVCASARSSTASLYAPLHVYSGYAFGRGTMLAEEIPLICAGVDIPAVAIVDPFSLAGCVELVKRSKAAGIKPLVGASVQLPCGGWLVLIAKSKAGYESLSKLISACHLEEPRQFPMCTWERLERFSRDLLCLTGGDIGPVNRLISMGRCDEARGLLDRLVAIYGQGDVFVEIERSYLPWEISVNRALLEIASEMGIGAVAGGLVTHARREHFPAQDILVCAETLCTVDEIIGRKPPRDPSQPQIEPRPERALNAERFLRTPEEMRELYSDPTDPSDLSDRSDLLRNTLRVAERCDDDVLPGRTRLPQISPDPNQVLREITYAGAHLRHAQITPRLKTRLEYELARICSLNFADHFLAIWDACRWASDQGIHFSGRGSVVDSAAAYCLGLSRIDAFRHNLHFDRFLPADGSKRPDIDVDFEARRRDDVRKYFSDKYGSDRVAGIAAIGAYCTRGIVREVGKALGLPDETIGFLAKRVHGGIPPDQLESALEKRPELARSGIPKERFRWVFEMAERLMDVPRNMRAHSSGLIVSDRPISEIAPVMWSASPFVRERIPSDEPAVGDRMSDVEWGKWSVASGAASDIRHPTYGSEPPTANCQPRTDALFPIIQWDKRSAKHFFDKFDILCLRGQDVLSGTQERIRVADKGFDVVGIAMDDEDTYRAMRSGELIGIPQSASPAMRQAHIRLRTKNLHDASLVQAGIRPGVGGAVKINELIARRRGKPYSFEHPDLERVLGNTYGIIVFQEQVDQLLQTFCGYTSGEAEDIREAIHKRRREDYGERMRLEIVRRVLRNGYSEAVAEKVYEYVSGFKGYGFAQGHALAFAEISIRSIYCQQNFPAEYFASLLTAQPAGYYWPCTLVNEARLRGAMVLPPDVNRSNETFSVEDVKSEMDPKLVLPNAGIRVGLMQVMGVSKETRRRIVSQRELRFTIDDLRLANGERGMWDVAPEATSDIRHSTFSSLFDFVSRVRPERDELENLILCGALDSLHANRRAMLWAIPSAMEHADLRLTIYDLRLKKQGAGSSRRSSGDSCGRSAHCEPQTANCNHPSPIVNRKSSIVNPALPLQLDEPDLPSGVEDFSPAEKAIFERGLLGLDVERHLMAFERERVASRGGITCAEAKKLKAGRKAIVVGNPIRLRFPPTPSGRRVVFFDLEDETGLLNVTCFDAVYRRDGHAIICSPYVTLIGIAQDRDGHTAFLARRVFAYHPAIHRLANAPGQLPLVTADFLAQ